MGGGGGGADGVVEGNGVVEVMVTGGGERVLPARSLMCLTKSLASILLAISGASCCIVSSISCM